MAEKLENKPQRSQRNGKAVQTPLNDNIVKKE